MSIADLIRAMGAAGAPVEAIALAVEAIEGQHKSANTQADEPSARQLRNARYYDGKRLKASEKRLNASYERLNASYERLNSDAAPFPPSSLSPRPPILTTPIPPSINTHTRGASFSKAQAIDFAGFWAVYPRKTAKGAAEKAYAKALTVISDPDPPGVLRAAAERFAQTCPEPQFTPHPATWLNSRRWEDEPDERRSQTQPAARQTFAANSRQSRTDASLRGAALAIARRRASNGGGDDDAGRYSEIESLSGHG